MLGSEWREVFYNEGGWSHSLRSLIPFQGNNTVHYGKRNIELSAVTSIASPILPIYGFPFAFTVSLDHRLRVWNLNSGKLVYMKDMLTGELDLNDTIKKVIDPSLSQLVKVFGTEEYPLVVTYSPLGTGQFKFWTPKLQDDGSLEMEDLFRGISLQPRTPSSDLWTLADFSVVIEKASMPRFSIWTLWKNNTTYRVQALDFGTGPSAQAMWSDGWTSMASETLREAPHPASFAGDPLDVSDKWLEFLLAPGRYTAATIETGLAILESNSGLSKNSTRRSESLPEKMCTVVASSNTLGRASDGSMDYEQLRASLEQQWLRFYRLLQELDKQRGEAQSLAIDPCGHMPCIILTDGIVAIRKCSRLERLWHNPEALPEGDIHVAAPLLAAAQFRDTLPETFLHNCRSKLLGEIFEEPSLTDPVRMRAFYDRCGFEYQIDDDSFTQLVDKLKELESGWKDITPMVFQAMLELLAPTEDGKEELQPASFGNRIIVRAIQEIVELHSNICLDQIILIVLIEAEINHSEDGIQFETAEIFSRLVAMLQRLELINWLVSTQISLPFNEHEKPTSATEEMSKKHQPGEEIVTVFEGVFRHLFTLSKQAMPPSVTKLVLQICAPDSRYEVHPATIQCFLLKHNRPDLAMDFARFASRDPFSIYVQGRACLASNDPMAASVFFKKAAFGICRFFDLLLMGIY
jgi:nuclear pore complex protein Nup160